MPQIRVWLHKIHGKLRAEVQVGLRDNNADPVDLPSGRERGGDEGGLLSLPVVISEGKVYVVYDERWEDELEGELHSDQE